MGKPRSLFTPRTWPLALLALMVAALPGAAGAQQPAPASAKPVVAQWQRFSTGQLNIDETVGLAYSPRGALFVAWSRTRPSANLDDLLVTSFPARGPDTHDIVTGWTSIGGASLVQANGSYRVFFDGIKTTLPGEKLFGLITASKRGQFAPWNLQPGPAATQDYAYARNPVAGIRGKEWLEAWPSNIDVDLHYGLDPSTEIIHLHPDNQNPPNQPKCCSIQPNIVTGKLWVDRGLNSGFVDVNVIGWCTSTPGSEGIYISAGLREGRFRVPETRGSACDETEKVPLATTPAIPPPSPDQPGSDARFYTAAVIHRVVPRSHVDANVLQVYRLSREPSPTTDLRAMDIEPANLGVDIVHPSIASGEDGRVYAAWVVRTRGGKETLYVRRTAPGFGAKEDTVKVPLPPRFDTVEDLDIGVPVGCHGVDIIARVTRLTSDRSLWRTHITYPACTG